MNPANHIRPLGDDDIARLEALLEAADPEESMVVEELDGFFAALACSPDPVPQHEWLAEVVGGGKAPDDALLKLLERHRIAVAGMLYDGSGYAPVLSYDDDGVAGGNAWAIGFVRGMALRPDAWSALEADKEHADALDPVMRLVAEAQAGMADGSGNGGDEDDEDDGADGGDEDDEGDGEEDESDEGEGEGGEPGRRIELPGPGDPIAADEREEVLHAMFDGVQDVYDFFRDERERRLGPAEPIRRAPGKVGRNDPCSCGSGRKFKSCCAARQQ
jgi:uncharacterized protein